MNHRKQTCTFILMTLLLATVFIGCGGKKAAPPPPPPPPPPPKAATATISVNPTSIQRGQSATLTWSTENAKTVTLQGATVAASGSQTVSPTQSTEYRLSAQGDSGTPEASSTARLTVTEPPPPPPPPHQASDDEIFSQSIHDIFFDYDRYDLRPESQSSLTQAAQAISQHSNWVVMIEGNCDERGSSEYNIGLGANRATAARDFLVKAGVNPSQLRTHSSGKEKAKECGNSESCWQNDRNDHFSLSH